MLRLGPMMGTHVLSEKQLKNTLSAKVAAKKSIKSRNVLGWPMNLEHWPALDTIVNNQLKTLLLSLLAPAKLPCWSLPFQVAKKVRGIERKEMRQKLNASVDTETCKMLRADLLLGMNSVVRGIAGGNAAVVVVAGESHQQRRLGKLVVDMCTQRDIPVAVVAMLQEATRQCLGFSCLALAVKKGASESHFGPLVARVTELSVTSLQKHQPSPVKSEKETRDVSLEIPVKQEVVSDAAQGGAMNVYKYRASRKHRAFVVEDKGKGELALWLAEEAKRESWPCEKAEPVKRTPKVDFSNQDFISFDGHESKTPTEAKVKLEPGDARGAAVKEEAKPKRKADYDNQDFISFGDSVASVEPKLKRKAEAAVTPCNAIALAGPASMTMAMEVADSQETKELITSRPRLPKYRPLIVKSIQPNPNKKKKKKKTEAAG